MGKVFQKQVITDLFCMNLSCERSSDILPLYCVGMESWLWRASKRAPTFSSSYWMAKPSLRVVSWDTITFSTLKFVKNKRQSIEKLD